MFDVGYLRQIPGMQVLCPGNCAELKKMLKWAVEVCEGPVAIRYPRGGDTCNMESDWSDCGCEISTHRTGSAATIVTYGSIVNNAIQAADILQEKDISVSLLRLTTIKPLPIDELLAKVAQNSPVFVLEEVNAGNGIRDALAYALLQAGRTHKVYGLNLGDGFITHGSMNQLYHLTHLDAESIALDIQEVLRSEN